MIAFQFSAQDDLSSKAIQAFSRGWPSHVDAILPDGGLLGARSDTCWGIPPGVQIRPPGYATFIRTQVIQLYSAAAQEAAWLAFLHAQLGKPYDEVAILGFAVDHDWRDPRKWFCSDLGAVSLETAGWFSSKLSVEAGGVTPRDFQLVLSPWAH
jgi:hypothetical protein